MFTETTSGQSQGTTTSDRIGIKRVQFREGKNIKRAQKISWKKFKIMNDVEGIPIQRLPVLQWISGIFWNHVS